METTCQTADLSVARLSQLSDDELYERLSAANAERAAIREVLRLRRARQKSQEVSA